MAHHDIFYTLPAGDRTYKRYQLVSLFLQEEPGEGKGTLASTYTYTVESWGKIHHLSMSSRKSKPRF